MKKIFLFAITLCPSLLAIAQSPDWYYIRPGNTGFAGDYHHTITGDRFGNIWSGGYMPFWSDGSVVRLDSEGVFTCWGNYDGYLPNDRVDAIAFDHNDELWVGTDQGIAHCDGQTWEQFTSSNSPLIYDQVRDLSVDNNNEVWATMSEFGQITDGGVAHYDGSEWELFTSSNSNLPTQVLEGIAVDAENNKWIGSNSGLIKYDGFNWILYHSGNSGLTSNDVTDVRIDSLDRVWAMTGSAIDIFDGTNWTHINSSNSPMDGTYNYDNFYVRGSQIIVCELGGGYYVHIYNGSTWQTLNSYDHVYDCYIDEKGNYWFCGISYVYKYDGSQLTLYSRYNTGLAEYFNEDMFIDSKNRKWFSNGNGGEQIFDCPYWESYGPWNEGLFPIPQDMSTLGTSTTEDSYGDIWFTYDGVYGYAVQIPEGDYQDYASWKVWDLYNSAPNFQMIQETEADDNGKVYFRLYSAGVSVYDHGTDSWETWDVTNSGLQATPIYCMTPQAGGKMWFAQFGYLTLYDNGTWSSIDLSTTPLNGVVNYVNDIQFDANQIMWLGTDNGLWKYDGTNWTQWTESNSDIAANYVSCIRFGNGDTVYVGAYNTFTWPYYGGISIFDGINFTSFLEGSSPIPHKQVEDLELDSLGNLWILCQSEGIAVYNPDGVKGFECIDRSLQGDFATVAPQIDSQNHELRVAAYPNPLLDQTTIFLALDKSEMVQVSLLDLSGRKLQEIYKGNLSSGQHEIHFARHEIASGIYLCEIRTSIKTSTIKLIVQ